MVVIGGKMINHNKELEFYNSTYKKLMESNKSFYFEIPQGYLNKHKVKEFLNNLEDFSYFDDGYHEILRLKYSPSNCHILMFDIKTDSGKPKYGKKYAYDFLVKFNEKSCLKFPCYYWNLVFEFAEIKEGELSKNYIIM